MLSPRSKPRYSALAFYKGESEIAAWGLVRIRPVAVVAVIDTWGTRILATRSLRFFLGLGCLRPKGWFQKGLLTFLGFSGNAEFNPWKSLPEFNESGSHKKSLRLCS